MKLVKHVDGLCRESASTQCEPAGKGRLAQAEVIELYCSENARTRSEREQVRHLALPVPNAVSLPIKERWPSG